MDADLLRQYLGFYQDLGFTTLYRRTAAVAPSAVMPAAEPVPAAPQTVSRALPGINLDSASLPLPGLAPENDTLQKIREDIGDCTRCRLHAGRHSIVFASGNEKARLVFV